MTFKLAQNFWVHVLGDASTHCKYSWDYGYLFIILLHFGYLQFLFIEIFIGVIIFENCNKIHNIHVNTTTKWMLLQHCSCCCCCHSHYQFPLLPLPPHPCPCPCCGGSDVATQCLPSHLSHHSCTCPAVHLGSPHLYSLTFVHAHPAIWAVPIHSTAVVPSDTVSRAVWDDPETQKAAEEKPPRVEWIANKTK